MMLTPFFLLNVNKMTVAIKTLKTVYWSPSRDSGVILRKSPTSLRMKKNKTIHSLSSHKAEKIPQTFLLTVT
jgi:hypothetical protein